MKKLIFILAFVFCVACQAFAEEEELVFGQYSARLACTGYTDTVAQSFFFPGGKMTKISLAVFSRYSEDHLSELLILSGDGPYQSIAHQQVVHVPSISPLFPDSDFVTPMDYEWGYVALQDGIDDGGIGFSDLATVFDLGEGGIILPAGTYTVMIVLYDAISNDGYRAITAFVSCGNWPCSPLEGDVYPDGRLYWGAALLDFGQNLDMGFEVSYVDISTHIEESGRQLALQVQNGQLIAPSDWSGGFLTASDAIGRIIWQRLVFGGEALSLPDNQLLLITLYKDRNERTAKIILAP